jgi:ADP-heptose:LPS heptosyltransferase
MRILVLRFSALGDVALLVPVLQKMQKDFPEAQITVVSKPFTKNLFNPLNVQFFAAELNSTHKGFLGLARLAWQLKNRVKPDVVVDLHAVLRTSILGFHFRAMGLKVLRLQKDRAGRKALTKYPAKELQQLKHSTEKYRETLVKTGLNFNFNPKIDNQVNFELNANTAIFWHQEKAQLNIGIAPFAMHKAKQWPSTKMISLLQSLPYPQVKLWFFGGPNEVEALTEIGTKSTKDFTVAAGRFSLDQEIALMQNLNALVAMDSSNMHLATLAGIPVVSIWGGTHPWAGFAPLGKNDQYIVQVPTDDLDCRPCSAFGAKPCFRGDYACLETLENKKVLEKLALALGCSGLNGLTSNQDPETK